MNEEQAPTWRPARSLKELKERIDFHEKATDFYKKLGPGKAQRVLLHRVGGRQLAKIMRRMQRGEP